MEINKYHSKSLLSKRIDHHCLPWKRLKVRERGWESFTVKSERQLMGCSGWGCWQRKLWVGSLAICFYVIDLGTILGFLWLVLRIKNYGSWLSLTKPWLFCAEWFRRGCGLASRAVYCTDYRSRFNCYILSIVYSFSQAHRKCV